MRHLLGSIAREFSDQVKEAKDAGHQTISKQDSGIAALVRRVLEEQYERQGDGAVILRPAGEMSADSLQSPHDPDATYHIKGGATYCGGYVTNVSETADPANPVQMITDVQVEPNRTDDAKLLEQSLDDQAARGLEVKQVTTDGEYTGPTGDAACEKYDVALRATGMRGGHSASDRWGRESYSWEVKDNGTHIAVICPHECRAALLPGRAQGRFIARFDDQRCRACPFFRQVCHVQQRKRVAPTLYVTRREIQVAQRRQRLHPEDGPIRAVVESTIRSLKRAFPGSKLPVRGLIRARMMLYPAALMVNLRRLHRYSSMTVAKATQEAVSFLSSLKSALCRCLKPIHHGFSAFRLAHNARLTVVSPS